MAHARMLVAFLLAVGCAGPAAPPGDTGRAAADDLDIYEAVFRYRLGKRAAAGAPADVVAYLSVDGRDPPAALLDRLRKDYPGLKPRSAEPKEKGLHLYVNDLRRAPDGSAVVQAGHSFPTKYAPEGAFADHHVVRQDGRWVVEKETNRTTS